VGVDVGYEEDVDRLYQQARAVRVEIESLWREAQTTDIAVKGAVSAAQNEKLGGRLQEIERAKKAHESSKH
jgi:hypothetical protein